MPSHRSSPDRVRLRRRFRDARRQLTSAEQLSNARQITHHFLCSPIVRRIHRIGLYLATDGEPDLSNLAARLTAFRKELSLPVVRFGSRMDFYRFHPGERLTYNRYGIGEPAREAGYCNTRSLDVILMPLVAFDDAGNRLGMGAGFYDKHLAPIPPCLRPRLIGIAHEAQRSADPLPATRWDVPLDAALTEAGWQRWNLPLG